MKFSRNSMFISFALLLGMISPMLAQGACSQSDLTGVWYTYGSDMGEIARCKIKVNSSGSIVGSRSKCTARDATGRYSLNVGGGYMGVADNCIVKGNLKFCEGGCVKANIEHGMLERDNNILTVEGYLVVDPSAVFYLVGVKR